MVFAAPRWWGSFSGGGIWSGFFMIIAGSLVISTGFNPNNKCLRYAALVICIVALVIASVSGLGNLVAFG